MIYFWELSTHRLSPFPHVVNIYIYNTKSNTIICQPKIRLEQSRDEQKKKEKKKVACLYDLESGDIWYVILLYAQIPNTLEYLVRQRLVGCANN